MSVVERPASPENEAQLTALKRMLRRADGFRLAFAVSNHPDLRARLAERVRRDLPDRRIAQVTLEPGQSAAPSRRSGAPPGTIRTRSSSTAWTASMRATAVLGRQQGSTSAGTCCGGGQVPVVFWLPEVDRAHVRPRGPGPVVGPLRDLSLRTGRRRRDDERPPGRRRLTGRRLPASAMSASSSYATSCTSSTIARTAGRRGPPWSLPRQRGLLRNRYAEAIGLYEEALGSIETRRAPGEATALDGLGEADMQNRFTDAIAQYGRALAIFREVD